MKILIYLISLIAITHPSLVEAKKNCDLIEVEGQFSFNDQDLLFIANKSSESEARFDIKNKKEIKINDLQEPYYYIQFQVLKNCHSEIKCPVHFKSVIKRYRDLDYKPKHFQLFDLYKAIKECKIDSKN
jgi:hypothetical protein